MTHIHGSKLSREELAKREIGVTAISAGLARGLTLCFCLMLGGVLVWQEVGDRLAGRVPRHWDGLKLVPTRAEAKAVLLSGHPLAAAKTVNNRLLREIRGYEDGLKEESLLVQELVPRVQVPITGWLKGGNEDVYVGRDGWLFYRPDIDHLTGKPFLSRPALAARATAGDELKAPPQPDPVKAIVDFHAQLAARGIALLVVPAPGKAAIHPERFSARYAATAAPLLNPSYGDCVARLRAAGVAVCDLAPVLWQARQQLGRPVYLATDTHWTPEGMEAAAAAVAEAARAAVSLSEATAVFQSRTVSVTNLGDSAGQLRLPAGQRFYPPETVTIRAVDAGTRPWRPDPRAEILLLGDSFCNIYSLEAMGWGEAAGLPERLSVHLGRPLDALVRNDAGAHATRRMLADELARGKDRLAGKRLVIWEFAMRELSCGDWRMIPLRLGEARSGGYYVPPAGSRVAVRAVVRAVSAAPRPGSVPYKDHIVMAQLGELEGPGDAGGGRDAVALVWSMRGNVWTPAARWRPGDRVRLVLQPWSDAARGLEAINRTELDDESLLEAEPCWAQWEER